MLTSTVEHGVPSTWRGQNARRFATMAALLVAAWEGNAADPAAPNAMSWGVGVYGNHVAAATELDRARWDWQFIKFTGWEEPQTPIATFNR